MLRVLLYSIVVSTAVIFSTYGLAVSAIEPVVMVANALYWIYGAFAIVTFSSNIWLNWMDAKYLDYIPGLNLWTIRQKRWEILFAMPLWTFVWFAGWNFIGAAFLGSAIMYQMFLTRMRNHILAKMIDEINGI